MSNTFFIADSHYGHANIASKNTSKWKGGWRNYDSIAHMNQSLVDGINSIVGQNDTLYHIGDWSFGGKDNIWNFRKQIYCKDIHLILGNHDHHIEENIILPNCKNMGGYFSDYPPMEGYPNTYVRAQDLFSSVSHYKEVKIDGQIYILSHYPFAVWHGNGKGWRHIHGHCHGTFKSIGLSTDVGTDTAIKYLGKPIPFSVEQIEKIMDKKNMELLDHHGPSTNTGKRPK